MAYSCSVYGLGLQYNQFIAGLSGLGPPARVDVQLTLGAMPPKGTGGVADAQSYHVSPSVDASGRPAVSVWRLLGGKYFRIEYADRTAIIADASGSAIWATWPDTASVEDTATYLLGPILAFVLRLRGVACLHASAVAIGNTAIALVGPSGSGKSSTAAAFARLGHSVLTDDVLALADHGDRFDVQPAYPRIRLWPESVGSLFGSVDALPRITPTWDKRFLDLNGPVYRFHRKPLPLRAIYFLAERSQGAGRCTVESLSPRAAFMDLVTNTHANYLLDRDQRAQEFELLGRLVQKVVLRRITPSSDLGGIFEVCQAIKDDLEVNTYEDADQL